MFSIECTSYIFSLFIIFISSFKKLCIKGYRILRRQYRQIICLLRLMMNCNLAELNREHGMGFLQQTFGIAAGLSEQDACDQFEKTLLNSYRSCLTTRVDWFFHALNQKIRRKQWSVNRTKKANEF